MYTLNSKPNLFTQKYKDELLFNSYKKKVQKGGNYKDICDYNYELANCYMNGKGVKKNDQEALPYLKIAARGGHMKAQFYLSNYYEEGKYIAKNINKAVYWCKKSAEQNYDLAQNKLGCYYEDGIYIDKNSIEAVKMFKKSADQNNGVAQTNLGLAYEYGRGTEINITEAIKWYKKGSKQDNCRAHCSLGNCYKYNKGIEKHDSNMKIAYTLYHKAIEQGCMCEETVYEYATCYENGEGIEKDLVKAFILYKKAADLEYPKACYKLADFYWCGSGTQVNMEESKKWREKALQLGYCSHTKQEQDTAFEKSRAKTQEQDTAFEKSRAKTQDTAFEKSRAKTQDTAFEKSRAKKDLEKQDTAFEKSRAKTKVLETIEQKDEIQNIVTNEFELSNLPKEEYKKDMAFYLNKEEFQNYMITNKFNNVEQNKMMGQFNFYKNNIEHSLKEQKIDEALSTNLKLNITKHNKELLDYYTKKLDIIIQFYLDNNIYENYYDEEDLDSESHYLYMLYLRYNYNCGVLNYELGNVEEAITYYEEAGYNKYPLAQKALSYCYKHGIYYEQSIEQAESWYNLYQENDLEKTAYKYHEKVLDIEDVD